MWQRLRETSPARLVTVSIVWSGAMIGALQLRHLPAGRWSHAVCGPWGCGPPLEALLACHGFWIVVLIPPTCFACRHMSRTALCRLAFALSAVSLAVLAGIGVLQVADWLPNASETQRPYLLHRYLFVVASLVDVPVLEVLTCGLACWVTSVSRRTGGGVDAPSAEIRSSDELNPRPTSVGELNPRPTSVVE